VPGKKPLLAKMKTKKFLKSATGVLRKRKRNRKRKSAVPEVLLSLSHKKKGV